MIVSNKSSNKKNSFKNNMITKLFGKIGMIVDGMFASRIFITAVAIIAAIVMYFYVNGLPGGVTTVGNYTRVIENVPVKVLYDDTTTVIKIYDEESNEVNPENIKVNVILTGLRSDVLKVTNREEYEFFIDASTLKDGQNQNVEIQHKNIPSSVSVDVRPSYFRIEYNKLQVRTDLTLSTEAINIQALGANFSISELNLNKNDVQVSGSQKSIDKVAAVKALVDVSEITQPGTYTYGSDSKNVNFIAYDNVGNPVDVKVTTKDLVITLNISNEFKEVPVRYVPVGLTSLPEGKSIGKIGANVERVNIYGSKEDLAKVEEIVVEVNIEDFIDTNSKVYPLIKPAGVSSMTKAASKTNVSETTVTLTIEDTVSKNIENVRIQQVNIGDGLVATAKDQDQSTLNVTVFGAKSILDSMNAEDILAEIDLEGLTVGEHTVNVVIANQDGRVKYEQDKERIVIIITESE